MQVPQLVKLRAQIQRSEAQLQTADILWQKVTKLYTEHELESIVDMYRKLPVSPWCYVLDGLITARTFKQ